MLRKVILVGSSIGRWRYTAEKRVDRRVYVVSDVAVPQGVGNEYS